MNNLVIKNVLIFSHTTEIGYRYTSKYQRSKNFKVKSQKELGRRTLVDKQYKIGIPNLFLRYGSVEDLARIACI